VARLQSRWVYMMPPRVAPPGRCVPCALAWGEWRTAVGLYKGHSDFGWIRLFRYSMAPFCFS
jgi:hypothetical protein